MSFRVSIYGFGILMGGTAVAANPSTQSGALPSQHLRNTNTIHSTAPGQRQLQTVSPYWDPSEDFQANYVHFNDTMKDYLAKEFEELMRGSPSVNIFTTFPEPDQRIWPLVKGMTIRNHLDPKILWATPTYLISDGLDMGCRELGADGVTSIPIEESTLCDDHCTHAGRYCHPELPVNLPPTVTGKSLVLEALRRLCIDRAYHASDYKFFRYLEDFERAGCLLSADMTACSLEVINKISWLDYANFADCVGDLNDIVSDVKNDVLEEQLVAAKNKNIDPASDIPSLYLADVKYEGELTTEAIFREYCGIFERDGKMHPVSCDICGGCQDVRKCLWTLECDGTPFDETKFLMLHNVIGPETPAPDTTSPPQPAPLPDIDNPVATLPPGGITTGSAAGTTVGTANGNTNDNNAPSEGVNDQTVLVFFMIALVFSALAAGLIVMRDRAARKRRANNAAALEHAEGAYRDDGCNDYDPKFNSDFDGMRNRGGYSDQDPAVELSPTRTSQPPNGAFMHQN